MALGDALLEERLLRQSLDEAFEHHRAAARAAQRAVGDRDVVAREVELGQSGLGEDHLAGARDAHLMPIHLQEGLRFRRRAHAATLTAMAAPEPARAHVSR